MVGAVDTRALGERVGHVSHDDARAIDDAVLLVLGLR
jgi:mRNA-degrading endonuclease toxin of MazEF toxin-antitoxin module